MASTTGETATCTRAGAFIATGSTELQPGSLVGDRFTVGAKIGQGAFGVVYIGMDKETGTNVAIKAEKRTVQSGSLAREAEAYRMLEGVEIVPRVHWEGQVSSGWRLLVTDLLGPSLHDLYSFCGKRFSVKTTLLLMDQMVSCLEYIHSAGLVHRDLKPDNFLIGLGDKANTVHLIDYGLATAWRHPTTKAHVRYREQRGFVGTTTFCSIGAHLGRQQSRRDDMEALGYVMLFFLRGSLPWQHAAKFCRTDAEKQKEFLDLKQTMPMAKLCASVPAEVGEYLTYARALKFQECPDYGLVQGMFHEAFVSRGFENDYVFDWTVVASKLLSAQNVEGSKQKSGKDTACSTSAAQSPKGVSTDDSGDRSA